MSRPLRSQSSLTTPTLASPDQVDRIAAIGRLRSPREACGVLARGALIELENRAIGNDLSLIDSDDLIDVCRSQDDDLRISELIIWHTHPRGHVGPGRMDIDNRQPGFNYLVVSLNSDGSHTGVHY